MATVAGRFGYAIDRWLIYVKGGGGWVGANGFTVTDVTTGGSVTGSAAATPSVVGWSAAALNGLLPTVGR